MRKLKANVAINRPPTEVFAGLTDFGTWPKGQGGLVSVDQISAGPLQVGSQIRQIRKGGKPTESLMEVTHLVQNQILGVKSQGRPLSWNGTFALEPVDGGTQLTLQFEIQTTGLVGLISYLIIRLTLQQELRAFKAITQAG
jgi:carbon monoxide dehydrogenase subunit G